MNYTNYESINAVITDASNVNVLPVVLSNDKKRIDYNVNNNFRILGVVFSGFQDKNALLCSVKPDDFDFLNLYVYKGISGATGLKSPIYSQKIIVEVQGNIEAPVFCSVFYEIMPKG